MVKNCVFGPRRSHDDIFVLDNCFLIFLSSAKDAIHKLMNCLVNQRIV